MVNENTMKTVQENLYRFTDDTYLADIFKKRDEVYVEAIARRPVMDKLSELCKLLDLLEQRIKAAGQTAYIEDEESERL